MHFQPDGPAIIPLQYRSVIEVAGLEPGFPGKAWVTFCRAIKPVWSPFSVFSSNTFPFRTLQMVLCAFCGPFPDPAFSPVRFKSGCFSRPPDQPGIPPASSINRRYSISKSKVR